MRNARLIWKNITCFAQAMVGQSYYGYPKCSLCKHKVAEDSKYCFQCGAKFEVGQ